MDDRQLDILYIAGAGRAGSTILGDVLGMLPKAIHVGELLGIFDYTTVADAIMPCSCGYPYEACEFWKPILGSLYGPNWPIEFKSRSIVKYLPHSYSLPRLTLDRQLRRQIRIDENLKGLLQEITQLLLLMRDTAGASVIIDSSKAGPFAWLLAQQPNVNIAVVHLVRDPRASMFSLTGRPIPKFDFETGQARIDTYRLKEAFLYWVKANTGASLLRFLGLPYMRLRYETFVTDPVKSVQQIIHFAHEYQIMMQEDSKAMADLHTKHANLRERHLISSNPGVRNKLGLVSLKEDTSWRHELPLTRKLMWTTLFLPWLIWFNYRLWPDSLSVPASKSEESTK
jgi:hypothetical protein